METERDWFRREALALSRANKALKDQIARLKLKYDAAIEQKIYFQTQLYDERLNSRVVAQENIEFKNNLIDQLRKQQNEYNCSND